VNGPNIHKRPFNPQTLIAPNSGSTPEPTRCDQTHAKFNKSPKRDADARGIVKALHQAG
jgi:hypothetical protein